MKSVHHWLIGVLGFLLTASLGTSAAYADPLITYDLRVTGTGAKDVTVSNPGQVVYLQIFALIANQDGDRTNDGLGGASLRFLSTETATSPVGDYQNAAKAPEFSDHGDLGGATNLDTNPDLEWGNTSNTSVAGNFNCFPNTTT